MPSRILGVIPARGGSKGLQNKNIRLLQNVPLVVHTIRAAQASRVLTDLLVSTDDSTIASVASESRVDVPFLRPAELSTDTASTWDVVRHAVRFWENKFQVRLDSIVVLQPTSPLRTADDIDRSIQMFYEQKADICVTVTLSSDNPYLNLVQKDSVGSQFVRPVADKMASYNRRQDAPQVYALNGAVYVIGRSQLEIVDNIFRFSRVAIVEMPRSRSIDIDNEDDLSLAEFWLERGVQK